MPYCVGCRLHIRALDYLQIAALILASLSILLGFSFGLLHGKLLAGLTAGGVVAALSGLAAIGGYLLVRSMLSAKCWGLPRSVLHLGSHGSVHTLEIRSPFYGAEFVRSNYRKLVNISPKVAAILKGTRFGDFQVPRRLLRQ